MTYREIHRVIHPLAINRGWIPKYVDVNSTGLYLMYNTGDHLYSGGFYALQMDSIMAHMNLSLKPQIAAEYLKEIILHYHPTIFDNKVCKFLYFNQCILELNIKTLS